MHEDVKQTIKASRERKANFSAEQMTNNLCEQFTQMIAHDATNESIARIKRIAIEKDISISKAIQMEVAFQVEERSRREQERFISSARNVLEALKPVAEENEAMKQKLHLVFHVGCKNASIPNDAFAQADCILMENEILHQLMPIADCIQGIQIKMGKSIYVQEVA